MFIVYTLKKKYWPKNEKIFLANRSLKFNLSEQDHKLYNILGDTPQPFVSDKELREAYKDIHIIAQSILNKLIKKMNIIHNVNMTDRYWKSYLGFWTYDYVSYIFHTYSLLRNIKSFNKKIKVAKFKTLNSINIPIDYVDFNVSTGKGSDDEYNQLIFASIAESLNINTVDLTNECMNVDHLSVNNENKKLKFRKKIGLIFILKKIYYFFHKILELFFIKKVKIINYCTGFPIKFQFSLFFKSKFRILELPYRRMEHHHYPNRMINLKVRKFLSLGNKDNSELENLMLKMIEYSIPRAFIENYKDIVIYSEKFFFMKPDVIYSPNSWWADHAFVHWASMARDKSAKTISGLHSGPNFLERDIALSEFEISNTDFYIGWAKKRYLNQNILTAPSNILIKYSNKKRNPTDSLLYLGANCTNYENRIFEDFPSYMTDQINFFNSLPSDILNKIKVRIHPEDTGWKFKQSLILKCNNLLFVNEEKYSDQIFNSRLCIVSYLGTTVYETISLNIPTIIFISPKFSTLLKANQNFKQFPLIQKMHKDLQMLKSIGILHENFESAVSWLNLNFNKIEEWWSSEKCQRAVLKFRDDYSSISSDPISDWYKILESTIRS